MLENATGPILPGIHLHKHFLDYCHTSTHQRIPKTRTVTGHTAPAIGSEPNWFQGGLAEIGSAKHYQRHHDLGRPANRMHTVEGILRSHA